MMQKELPCEAEECWAPKSPATKYHVASVVLNYNSDADLFQSAPQLAAQHNVHHSLILVDNASSNACIQRIRAWLQDWSPNSIVGGLDDIEEWLKDNRELAKRSGHVYFILNDTNRGYSAGNNVGIRLAAMLGADAVLIANPDMRIAEPGYLASLSSRLFADTRNYIAASRIVGLDNKDQNPLREATFWEELLWPRAYFAKLFGAGSYVLPITTDKPVAVQKVSGCCLMLRMSFLQATDYLDENVFLYCEEPILSAKVARAGGIILYVPKLTAVHAHMNSRKGNVATRMTHFIRSRLYYIRNYSGYSLWRIRCLVTSYALMEWVYRRFASYRAYRNVD